MSLYICEKCGEAVEAETRPRGWERDAGSSGPWWCNACVGQLLDDVQVEMHKAARAGRF